MIDMNDIVLEVKKRKISIDKHNKVTEFNLSVELRAVGAQKTIAAAIMFDEIPASAVTQAVTYADNYQPVSFELTDKNIEKGQEYAVVPLFDNAHTLMERPTGSFVNTVSGSDNNQKNTQTIHFTLRFDSSVAPSSDALNINNLNIFIITDRGSKRKEIHVAGYRPTLLANTELFGGNNDASSLNGKKYYISKDNLAWGIMVPTQFKWPLEYTQIQKAYSQFAGWVTRCVYHCDNNVVDHQVVNMELEGGATVSFTMCAFTSRSHREIKIMGTKGDIAANMGDNIIDVGVFGKEHRYIDVNKLASDFSGHAGGDNRMVSELLDLVAGTADGKTALTSIDRSLESHYAALAAEYSRLHGGKSVELADFVREKA